MNRIEGRIVVGAPGSVMRYRNSHRTCAKCFDRAPVDLEILEYHGAPAFLPNETCYVCEMQMPTVAITRAKETPE